MLLFLRTYLTIMKTWDEIFETNPKYKPLNDVFLSRLLNKIKLEINSSPEKIVDLGCGMADTVFQFAQRGFNVVGIDVSKIALKKLEEKISSTNAQNITLRLGDLNTFSEKIEADIFLCNFVYTFIQNKDNFIKYVLGCMKENSVFIIITPVKYKDITYSELDKPNIAVDFDETVIRLREIFSSVKEYHHDYIGMREDYVTFLIKK